MYLDTSDVILISNHVNSGGGEGAEVIYALRNKDTLAKNILNNIGATGQETRKYYQRRLPSDTSKDYYFIHRNTGNLEPLIVEYGFIDSAKDVNFLKENYDLKQWYLVYWQCYIMSHPFVLCRYWLLILQVVCMVLLYSTVDEIKRLNNLTSNNLIIGQTLKLPSPLTLENTLLLYSLLLLI